MQEIVNAYKDKGDVKQVQSTGLHVAGERFIVIKAEDRSLYGKKVRCFPFSFFPPAHLSPPGFLLLQSGGCRA